MHTDRFTKLDNPAWWALTGVQQPFAIGTDHVKRYQRGILPFAAYESGAGERIHELSNWLQSGEIFYLIGELPSLPQSFTLLKELPCVQMIWQKTANIEEENTLVSPLTAAHSKDMFNLINKVQPGYYEPDTHRLGNYYGVWLNNQLVAIAGERIRLEQLTEISAICTDPDYTGRRYAQQLITHLCHANGEQGNTPFLHVLETNERAIRLYEYLGFVKRRMISFWQVGYKV